MNIKINSITSKKYAICGLTKPTSAMVEHRITNSRSLKRARIIVSGVSHGSEKAYDLINQVTPVVGALNILLHKIEKANILSSISAEEIGKLKRSHDQLFDISARTHDLFHSVAHTKKGGSRSIKGWKASLSSIESDYKDVEKAIKDLTSNKFFEEYFGQWDLLPGLTSVQRIISETLMNLDGKPVKEPVNVNALLKNVLAPLARENPDLTVIEDLGPDLPCLSATAGLQRVFYNIIFNAIKMMNEFAEENGSTEKKLELRTFLSEDKREIIVQISDSGPGIKKEDMPNIFKLFYTKARGSGIGLAVAEQTVSDHGGSISAENESGKGAKFTITLPIDPIPERLERIPARALLKISEISLKEGR
ncbi:MAG: ATP-binding protein [bacterium]